MAWVDHIKKEFPLLQEKIHGHRLAYLDTAATAQKPQCVLNAMNYYYEHQNANVHRGVHQLSVVATEAYESTRATVRDFIRAQHLEEIIFTKGTTEAINLVAQAYLRPLLKAGDTVLLSMMEHHSNIVPWQLVCEQTGANVAVIPMNNQGELILDQLDSLLTPTTKLLAVTHVSNALGTINPIEYLIKKAHEKGIPVLIDGAQAVQHISVDVTALDCDFYAFSGHKLYGPTGIGVLYGKKKLLNAIPPYQGGGDMIERVSFEKTTYHHLPYKFEAGTPNIAGAVGLKAAIDFVNSHTLSAIAAHESALLAYAHETLKNVKGLRFIGEAREKTSVISFVLDSCHPHDIGTIVDHAGVAIRTGHHCSMPVMDFFKVPATARLSLGMYNNEEDVDQLANALHEVNRIFHT